VNVTIRQESIARLGAQGETSIEFVVERVLDVSVIDQGLGGIVLIEKEAGSPWRKDNDSSDEHRPTRWSERFDTANWGLFRAYDDETRVGGAVIAFDTPDVWMLEGRKDLAALWDLRVHPDRRSCGVGSALFSAAEDWARARGCRRLKVETQNTNVPACRFYARRGCTLGGINRFAYRHMPDETQLLWFKEL
jgi:GNAT superfamily N-acetyltransferase